MDTAHEQPSSGDVLITTEIGVHFLSVVPHHHRLSFRELPAAINIATQWAADLIVICSRSSHSPGPPLGPKSVGHIARFVLDHAPCPVLLVRPRSNASA